MSLITSSSLVAYLKADVNDAPAIDTFLTGSINAMENYLNTTITAASQSESIMQSTFRPMTYANAIYTRCYPIVSSSVTITGYTGIVPFQTQVDTDRGIIYKVGIGPNIFPTYYNTANQQFGFTDFPYAVSYVGGLQTAPDYLTRYEPILNQCIREIVADWYYSRNPRVASESETGTSNTYFNTDIAPRTKALLNLLKRKPR